MGYIYEHGLGVSVDYDRALSFYDRAHQSVPVAGADVDGNLGMPIQLLIFIAKARLHLNRASGGRLATLWKQEEGHEGAKYWLPNRFPSAAVSDKLSLLRWVAILWNGPGVLNHLGHNTQHDGRPLQASGFEVATDTILLIALSSLLLAVLLLRRRRHQPRSPLRPHSFCTNK
ncbi:unnamed protein product [Scytosiphon promiscuus]